MGYRRPCLPCLSGTLLQIRHFSVHLLQLVSCTSLGYRHQLQYRRQWHGVPGLFRHMHRS
ncbi:Alpha-1,2 mannosyltransferase [Komagataella phaffii CBS 7435]|uniref:Alpha-1,2 mannosyltransferase n=1 Tax=Komagataella phaffii (strain ATCC 76273 / CBS 7435 / CECT 11047 / NRRL Y-11430 / Wegner 21-1) TaxID=981350 RepID=A0A1G4KQI2_KOMPC|nr:Hypothetical protein BQ9382_C3-4438 [Komagataella phaffii CBS 7435]SCV12262.1 Alpha-1,2 mannosyltransferase [Komagataella phaffii CBS 7435]